MDNRTTGQQDNGTVSTELVNTDILNDGGFIVAWYNFSSIPKHGHNIHGQIYDANGETNVSALLPPPYLFVIYLRSALTQAIRGTYTLSQADVSSNTYSGLSPASITKAEILGISTIIGGNLFVLKCVSSTAKVTSFHNHQTVAMSETHNFLFDSQHFDFLSANDTSPSHNYYDSHLDNGQVKYCI